MLVLTRKQNESVIFRRRWINTLEHMPDVGEWVLGIHKGSHLPVVCKRQLLAVWVNDLLFNVPAPARWSSIPDWAEDHPGGERIGQVVVVDNLREVRLGFEFVPEIGLLREEVDIAAGMREGSR